MLPQFRRSGPRHTCIHVQLWCTMLLLVWLALVPLSMADLCGHDAFCVCNTDRMVCEGLTAIESDFHVPADTVNIDLSGNAITAIAADTFADLVLHTLALGGNRLSTVPTLAFRNTTITDLCVHPSFNLFSNCMRYLFIFWREGRRSLK